MENSVIFTTRRIHLFVTRGNVLFHSTSLSVRQQGQIKNLPPAPVNAYNKAAGGNQHQKGQCEN